LKLCIWEIVINHILAEQAIINDAIHQLFNAVDAISVQGYDEERRVIYWNAGSEILYGYAQAEALGKKIEDLIIPDAMRDAVIAAVHAWVEQDITIPASEMILHDKNGNDVNVFSSHVMFADQYNKKRMYCIDINMAEQKDAQAQALLRQNMLEALLATTPDLFFLLEEDGTILNYHASDNKKLYAPPEQFIGKSMAEIMPEEVSTKFFNHVAKSKQSGTVSTYEFELSLPDGLYYFESRVSYLASYKQVMSITRDITEQYKAAETIREQAYFDHLTSLPNRFLSLDRLSQMINEAKRNRDKTAVLFLDLDDFKKVNDSLGHEAGDKLLIEAAKRLRTAVREEDTVGRLGGDEFIVLLRALSEDEQSLKVTEHLLDLFREPFRIDNRELILTVSIGIAIYPENGTSASDLLRNADTAMYRAKASGRNAYSFFTKEMNEIVRRRFEVEAQINGALERGEFEVYYQPKVEAKSARIIGAEALLRWHNPALGSVTPDEFIPIAEHTGLIVPIGEYVLKQALKFLSEWQSSQQQSFTMAVNLSPRQFRDKGLISFIKQTLNAENIHAKQLEFEITEGVLMTGESYINDALRELNKLGIKLSMDDFGTGYSSISYLRQYAFDVLKIDRSFVSGITTNKSDCDLVKATIAMAHSLGLIVVAEGVESLEQLSLLKALECDYIQGFYFSKPIRGQELIEFDFSSLHR
jgi:diguanylate cyclase (GGDEF)-like protein/PAS domain S-box-containing protein